MWFSNTLNFLQSRKIFFLGIGLIFVAFISGLLFSSDKPNAMRSESGSWVTPTMTFQEDRVVFKGTVLPVQSIDVSPAADGTLDSMSVAWGDRVQKGQPLFTVKSNELEQQLRDAQVASIKGNLEFEGQINPESSVEYQGVFRRQAQAVNSLKKAKAKQLETQALFDKGYVARNELDDAAQQVFSAQQDLQAADQEVAVTRKKWGPDFRKAALLEQQTRTEKLERLQKLMASSTVLSPMDGVVLYPIQPDSKDGSTQREFKKGSVVTARDVIMTIGDTSAYTVRGQIGESDLRWMRVGMPVSIRLGSLMQDENVEGSVYRIAAQAQPQSRGRDSGGPGGHSSPEFEIQIQLPPAGKVLSAEAATAVRIGGTVSAEVVSRSNEESISIPVRAIRWDSYGKPYVLERTSTGSKSEERTIVIAKMTAAMAFISGDLQKGSQIWVPSVPDATSANHESESTFGKLLRTFIQDE